MKDIILRLVEPELDFRQLAAWFTDLDDEPNTESGLKKYYEKNRELIISMVGKDERGELLGFYWIQFDGLETECATIYLYVKPERRGQGSGGQLYEDLLRAAEGAQLKKLRVRVWDNCPECRAFAERRDFIEQSHAMMMSLDLDTFDDKLYDEIIIRLKGEGFQFTSMQELGNTVEAQRNLYSLNETTGMEIPGADGKPSWGSFEIFQQSVCQSDWYKPDGQIVVIDTATDTWAAMSAITRFDGADYAYNLHTGVDKRYRGRKLGQAVKVLEGQVE